MKSCHVKRGRLLAAKLAGVQTFEKVSYSIKFDGGPSSALKDSIIVAISPKISDGKAIKLLKRIITNLKESKARREGAERYTWTFHDYVHDLRRLRAHL